MKKKLLFISINLIFILNLIIYLLLDNKNYQECNTNNSSDFEKAVYDKYYDTKVKLDDMFDNCIFFPNAVHTEGILVYGRCFF